MLRSTYPRGEREKRVEGNTLEGAANEEKEEEEEMEDGDKRERDGGRRTMENDGNAYTRAKPDIIVVVVVYFAHLGTTSPFTVREEMRAFAVVTWTPI